MADESAPADEAPITFHVKSSNNAKYTLTLSSSTTTLDLKNKLASSEYANTPADHQRLIYSGRVLKDNDTLAQHKVKDGNTMHLVKSAPSNQRQNPAGQSTSTTSTSSTPAVQPAANVPTNLATGPGNNPLAGLTGARYAGFAQLPGAGMFGPDGGMGPPADPEHMIEMLQDPMFASQLNEALQNPQLIDMMIQSNPQLRAMGPQVRQMLQSPHFRRMMTDPESLRQMSQMQRMMGMGPYGQAGDSAFPAPGVTNTTPGEQTGNSPTPNQTNSTPAPQPPINPFALFGGAGAAAGQNPFAALFGPPPNNPASPPATGPGSTSASGEQQNTSDRNTASPPPPNPFAALFNPAQFGQQQQQQQGEGNTGSQEPQGPSMFSDPAFLASMMHAFGGGGANTGGANGQPAIPPVSPEMFQAALRNLGMGGIGSPPPPADNRPPEERYAEQLRQLNDMGFFDFDRNIEALRRSGGSVEGAVEYLFTH